MIWKRHYEVQSNPLKKSYLYAQWLKMHAFERKMCRRFDSRFPFANLSLI